MQCPYCHQDDDRVVNSRPSSDGTYVKRRRECNACARRFTTYERIEESVLRVAKKDGTRQNFERHRIMTGLTKACYKRPISSEQLDDLVDAVERELHRRYEREVPSDAIGELVMDQLRALDQVAYIRFASVYRAFSDVTDFVEEAGTVMRDAPPPAEDDAVQQNNGDESTGM
jgi:transcriptional repressor NrdR